jgi:hypothetical protein
VRAGRGRNHDDVGVDDVGRSRRAEQLANRVSLRRREGNDIATSQEPA